MNVTSSGIENGMIKYKQGFFLNELYHAMDGHILEQCTLKGIYEN